MVKRITQIALLLLVLFLFSQSINTMGVGNTIQTTNTTENPYDIFHNTNTLEDLGIDYAAFDEIDSIANDALVNKAFPGCQILIMKNGSTMYEKCFGQLDDEMNQQVTPNTLYDIASLSKTSATLLAVMKLYDTGKLSLDDKASKYLNFLRDTDKKNISIEQLLFHTSGLQPSISCYWLALEEKTNKPTAKPETTKVNIDSKKWQYKDGLTSTSKTDIFNIEVADNFYLHAKCHDEAMHKLANTKLGAKVYVYSCINFILLKEIIEVITQMPLNEFLDREFYKPMGLQHCTYRPLQKYKKENIAPTLKKDYFRSVKLQGHVHDPDAAFLGGVSGNAGLFSNARDIALIHQMLLNKGTLNGKQYLSEATCYLFTTTVSSTGRRGLGFNKPVPSEPNKNPCCPSAPMSTYGHTGYTGTACWVDPDNEVIFVFLSNRTYPNDGVNKLARMNIRPQIQEVIYKSMKLTANK